jgi:DNA-binding NarL/FixJ family response regulator
MVRILICEDDGRFRRLLVKLLSAVEGFEVVGDAGTGEQVCDLVSFLSPDLLLLDLELPGIGGMEVIERLHLPAADEPPEILVLTTFADEDKLFEAMRRGAAGYLVKGLASSKLESAIREIMAGGTVIEARLARRFWNYFASEKGSQGEEYGLTEEELWVLTLVGRGLSNPEAAEVIGSSRRAVKSHLARIYRKLGVSSRVEATVKALRAGLIEL